MVHAQTELSISFQNSCAAVMSEIKIRVAAGEAGKWVDPHNKGKYTIRSNSDTQMALSHLTGNGKYTDEILLTFTGSGETCSVAACSESQVFSVLDMSTNYCNIHDLYCADPQCNAGALPGHTKLTYTEDIKTCSSHQHATSDCYKSSAAPTSVSSAAADATTTYISSFDGSKGDKFTWLNQDDPVMGGASTSTFTPGADAGVFNGTCAIVSFLKAPGFAKVTGTPTTGAVQDVSRHLNGSLAMMVRSSTPEYKGFKVAFAAKNIPKTSVFGGGSFKAGFSVSGEGWQEVRVPFSSFSYDWSGYTGNCDTKDPGIFGKQHHCCSSEHPEVCPTAKFLSEITDVEVWAEGVKGDFHIEVRWFGAADAQ